MLNLFSKNKKGFSLGETILALYVVSLGIVIIVRLISGSLKESMLNVNTVVASMLAQEGVELFTNLVENNRAQIQPFTNGFPSIAVGSSYCIDASTLTTSDPTISSCTTNAQSKLGYEAASGFIGHSGSQPFNFYRRTLVTASSVTKVDIVSMVWWGNKITTVPVWNTSTKVTDCTINNNCVYAVYSLTNY